MSESQSPEDEPIALPLDAEAGPAHYITRAKSDAMILRALDQAGFALPGSLSAPAPMNDVAAAAAAPRERRRRSVGWLAVAAVVLCATVGSASAAVLWYAKVRGPTPVTTNPTPRGERVESSRRAPAPRSAAPVAPVVEAPAPEPAIAAPDKPAKRAPEDWLVEGNRLRAEKRWHGADEAYTLAYRAAPDSHSAYVARVASAAVRLEHLHNPRGALHNYRAALRQLPTGPLSEEIHYGIADALRAVGDLEAERAALELFLREHPDSALAAQARARLER